MKSDLILTHSEYLLGILEKSPAGDNALVLTTALSIHARYFEDSLPLRFDSVAPDDISVLGALYLGMSGKIRIGGDNTDALKKVSWQMLAGMKQSIRQSRGDERFFVSFCEGMDLHIRNQSGMDKSYCLNTALEFIAAFPARPKSAGGFVLQWLQDFAKNGTFQSSYLDRKLKEHVLEFTGVDDGFSALFVHEKKWQTDNPGDKASLEALGDMAKCLIVYFYRNGEMRKALGLADEVLAIFIKSAAAANHSMSAEDTTSIPLPWFVQSFVALVQDDLVAGGLSVEDTFEVKSSLYKLSDKYDGIQKCRSNFQAYATLNFIAKGEIKLAHEAFECWQKTELEETVQDEFPWLIHQALKSVTSKDADSNVQRIQFLRLFIRVQKTEGPCALRSCFLSHAAKVAGYWGAFPAWIDSFEGDLFQKDDFTPWRIPNTDRSVDPLVLRVGKGMYQSMKYVHRVLRKSGDSNPTAQKSFIEQVPKALAFCDQYRAFLEADPYFHYRYAMLQFWGGNTLESRKLLIQQAPKLMEDFWYWLALADLYEEDPPLRLRCLCRAVDVAPDDEGKKFLGRAIRELRSSLSTDFSEETVRHLSGEALHLIRGEGAPHNASVLSERSVVLLLNPIPVHVPILPGLDLSGFDAGLPISVSLLSAGNSHLATSVIAREDGDLWDVFPEEVTVVERVDETRRLVHLWNQHDVRYAISTKRYTPAKIWRPGDVYLLRVEIGQSYSRIREAKALDQANDFVRSFQGKLEPTESGFACDEGSVMIQLEQLYGIQPHTFPCVSGKAFRPEHSPVWRAVTVNRLTKTT